MFDIIEGEVFVDFIGDGDEVVFDAEVGNLREFFAGIDFAGGVVRGVDEDGFCRAGGDGVFEFVEVE